MGNRPHTQLVLFAIQHEQLVGHGLIIFAATKYDHVLPDAYEQKGMPLHDAGLHLAYHKIKGF